MFHNEASVMIYYVSFYVVRIFIVTEFPSFKYPFVFYWLHKTESAVFKLWMLYFQRIFFTDYLETTTAVVVPCGGPKNLRVHRYSVVNFTFSGLLGLWGSTRLFESRVALNPGLGGVRDVASAIISHEQTQLSKSLDAVFPKDLFYRLFKEFIWIYIWHQPIDHLIRLNEPGGTPAILKTLQV